VKKLRCAGCCLILASWLPVRGGEPPCVGHIEPCRTVNRTILNAVVTKTSCTTEVTEKKGYTVQTKDVPCEVPIVRMVPVCVQDPCTGQKRTVFRPETVMQKATTTYIIVLLPEGPDTTRKQEQIKMNVNVLIGHTPAPIVEQASPSPKRPLGR
jgi:hypothetical protein